MIWELNKGLIYTPNLRISSPKGLGFQLDDYGAFYLKFKKIISTQHRRKRKLIKPQYRKNVKLI